MERRIRARLEMIQANEFQKELKTKKAEEERVEEQAFRSKMMDKFAEGARPSLSALAVCLAGAVGIRPGCITVRPGLVITRAE